MADEMTIEQQEQEFALRCRYCGHGLEILTGFDRHGYETFESITCDNWDCDAKWDQFGNVVSGPFPRCEAKSESGESCTWRADHTRYAAGREFHSW